MSRHRWAAWIFAFWQGAAIVLKLTTDLPVPWWLVLLPLIVAAAALLSALMYIAVAVAYLSEPEP